MLPSINALDQFGNLHLEGPGDGVDGQQGKVPLAALDLSDVGPMQVAGFAHLFLGPVAALPQFADPLAEGAFEVSRHGTSVIAQYLYF